MKNKIWIFCIFMISTTLCNASWGTPGLGQYHIQTDEGPERYFRYQTDNGQYRKEKRLQDGTVIGTDAWIDAAGFLRAKDYIADSQGYRILKSKTVFVGQGRPIEEAMRSIKNLPAQSGILANPGRVHSPVTTPRPQFFYSTTTPSTTTIPTTVAPIPSTTTYYSSTSTNHPGYNYQPVAPQVFIRHHSEPLEYDNKNSLNSLSHYYPTSTSQPFLAPPSSTYEPPYSDNRDRYEQIKPIAILSTTPSPISSNSISDGSYYPSSTHDSHQISSTTATPFSTTYPSISSSSTSSSISSTTYRPEYSSTTPDYGTRHTTNINPYQPITDQPYESSTIRPIIPVDDNNLRVQPLFSRQQHIPSKSYRSYDGGPSPLIYNNNLGSGYEPQFPKYDGISVNRNGFSYYLPKQYHEEDNTDPDRRQGGFGYIDPFGIRRVIYYNTSPEKGFEHRKNNRYVGLDATPYDPRPL